MNPHFEEKYAEGYLLYLKMRKTDRLIEKELRMIPVHTEEFHKKAKQLRASKMVVSLLKVAIDMMKTC